MKPLVLYHKDCLDGFGAAYAAYLALGDEAEYRAVQYHEPPPLMSEILGRDVYILDFSFPKPVMEAIMQDARSVVWLDHHKTAFEMWCPGELIRYSCKFPVIILDNNKSGALLAYEFFHASKEVPLLFRIIDDGDRWQFKLPFTRAVTKALWSYAPWSFSYWTAQGWGSPNKDEDLYAVEKLVGEGSAILRYHEQNVKAIVEALTRPCKFEVPQDLTPGDMFGTGSPWPVVFGLSANCPHFMSSDIGHELALKSGTFGLLWSVGSKDRVRCGLRSNGDYDVSAIAKAFGGGGHKNAAGFEIDLHTLLGWIK